MEPVGNKFNWILDNDCSSCSSLFFLWLFSFPFCDFFSFLRFEMQGFTREVLSKKFPLCSNTHIELDKAIIILVNMLQYQEMAKPDRWKQEDVTKGYQDQRPRKTGKRGFVSSGQCSSMQAIGFNGCCEGLWLWIGHSPYSPDLTIICSPALKKHLTGNQYFSDVDIISAVDFFDKYNEH